MTGAIKKLIFILTLVQLSNVYAGGGDSFAGGLAGGMLGGMVRPREERTVVVKEGSEARNNEEVYRTQRLETLKTHLDVKLITSEEKSTVYNVELTILRHALVVDNN